MFIWHFGHGGRSAFKRSARDSIFPFLTNCHAAGDGRTLGVQRKSAIYKRTKNLNCDDLTQVARIAHSQRLTVMLLCSDERGGPYLRLDRVHKRRNARAGHAETDLVIERGLNVLL